MPLKDSNQPRTGLISEVYLSARQLIALELELVLELGATTSHIQASTETLTHRKPILYLLFKSQGPPGHQFLEVGDIVFPVGEQVVSDSV